MKLGIIGLDGAGKKTVFDALLGNANGHGNGSRLGAANVPDRRVTVLSEMYNPKKTTYAKVEYLLPAANGGGDNGDKETLLREVRNCDALIDVVRNFGASGFGPASPLDEFNQFNHEMVFSDYALVEKRLERMEQDKKRGKAVDAEEVKALSTCRAILEQDVPLRRRPDLASVKQLRGYQLLSAKPMLVLFNNQDDDDALPAASSRLSGEESMVIRGKLERELTLMAEEDAVEFLKEFGIAERAMDRVIIRSYALLGLISFFTVGEDEVKAWTIPKDTDAVDAAEAIHSDIKKGFIRAEVVSYEDLIAAGSYAEARKKGTVRLEGKTYKVSDGDIINFRFNV